MRIVSQDGTIDIPYERIVIKMSDNPRSVAIFALFEREDYMKDIVMGYYSTKEKAIKAMKMVREAYNTRSFIQMTYSDMNLAKLLSKTDEAEVTKMCSNIFQFPKDDEIEV